MIQTKRYSGTPFTVTCSQVQNSPGTWNSTKVSIYWGEDLIGEYVRNYSSFAAETFYPFQRNGQWYALYSAQYTALRVMKLHAHTIEDWCGEKASSNGFCPVEAYIPKYNTTVETFKNGDEETTYESYNVDADIPELEFIEETKLPNYKGTTYCDFGLICGCVWGDDTSWKIRHVDLTLIEDKILGITDKFGYWEMPSALKLKECLDMSGWEPDHQWIRLTKMEHINLKTNERG